MLGALQPGWDIGSRLLHRAIISADSLRQYLLGRFQETTPWPESASSVWD